MKVAFLTYQYPPKFSHGGSFYAYKLTHAMEDAGFELLRIGPSFMSDAGIKLPARNLLHFAWKASRHIGNVDIVHGNILADLFVNNKPCVTTMHHPQKYDYPNCSSPKKMLYGMIEKRCFQKAKKVITDSKSSLNDLRKIHGNGKIHSIPLGVDPVRKPQSGDPHKILCATGLGIRKGIELVLHTSKQLAEYPAEFYITGGGGEKQRLESLAAKMKLKNVHFLGVVNEEKFGELYSTCGICIVPSLYEGFGLPILDGMAHGKAVITTNVGIAPELIENRKNGFVIDERNPRVVASIILKLIGDEKLFRTVARGALSASKKFSWKKTAGETIRLYKAVLGNE